MYSSGLWAKCDRESGSWRVWYCKKSHSVKKAMRLVIHVLSFTGDILFVLKDATQSVGDALGELVGVLRLGQHILLRHLLLAPQLKEAVVEELHAEFAARLNGRVDSKGFIFTDQIADGRRANEDLISRDATAADLRQQCLRDHADDGRGELRAHLLLLVGGKGIDDTVDGALRARCVQRAEDDVARLGCRDRSLDCLQIAQLAHEDHVGILPQGTPEGFGKAGNVAANLALIDRAFLRLVIKLNRIFDRDDVVVVVFVDEIDQAGKRGAFARPGWARYKKQSPRPRGQLLANSRHAKLLGREHFVRYLSQHHGNAAALLKNTDAKASHVAEGKAKVAATFFSQLRLATLGCDRLHQAVCIVSRQHLGGLSLHVTVNAEHWWQAGSDVDVADAIFHSRVEQFVDLDRAGRGARQGVVRSGSAAY